MTWVIGGSKCMKVMVHNKMDGKFRPVYNLRKQRCFHSMPWEWEIWGSIHTHLDKMLKRPFDPNRDKKFPAHTYLDKFENSTFFSHTLLECTLNLSRAVISVFSKNSTFARLDHQLSDSGEWPRLLLSRLRQLASVFKVIYSGKQKSINSIFGSQKHV